MKKIALILTVAVLLFSCKNDDDNAPENNSPVIGTWKITAIYLDPGDGTGDFQEVTSAKKVSFFVDGTVTSSGNLCEISNASETATSGTYSLTTGVITVSDCTNQNYSTSFELIDSNLIITYLCIEGCKEKYVKVE